MVASVQKFYMSGREIRERGPLDVSQGNQKWTYDEFEQIGFGGLAAMDSAITGPAVNGGFIRREVLQHVLPGLIRTATQVRVLDEITGILNAGEWFSEEIGLKVVTPVAKAELYGDHTNIPLASYIQDEEWRGVVRFEQGFHVGKLEEARQNAAGYDDTSEKRASSAESLEVSRERVGYYGFNSPDTRVFGLLNEPNLPAYRTASASWLGASFEVITGDVTGMFSDLEVRSGGRIKDDTPMTMVLPLGYRSILSIANPTGRGETVKQWLNENYPNVRVIFDPNFVGANGGANAVYLFADSIADGSTATDSVILQVVPTKYMLLGSEAQIKGYLEDATNATSGIFVTRPWGVTRLSGV